MKKYINPVCKVMTLNLKHSVLNELLGNQSFVPVGDVKDDNGYEEAVNEMFSNKSVWD